MKKLNLKLRNNRNGITLIALVITIVVLLILAGVSIATLTGENGILTRANDAKEKTSEAEAKESVQVEVLGSYGTDGKIDLALLNNNLKNNVPNLTFNGNQISDTNKIESLPATVKVNGYDVVIEGNVATPTDKEINAGEVSKNPETYYGSKVINYVPAGCDLDVGWKIFYADENNIYLIADDYVPIDSVPKSKLGNSVTADKYYGIQAADFRGIYNDYIGTEDIKTENLRKLNSSYFSQGFESTNIDMKSVAYLLDTSEKVWGQFTNEYAEFAIGGPTIEMLLKSYCQIYKTDYQAKAINVFGYNISFDGGEHFQNNNIDDEPIKSYNNLYYIESDSTAWGTWLASPHYNSYASSTNGNCVMYVTNEGTLVGDDIKSSRYPTNGFRPVICLNSSVKLQKNDDNTYNIL